MKWNFFLEAILLILCIPLVFIAQGTDTTKIVIRRNEKFDIKLDFCPGAGYRWDIDTLNMVTVRLINYKKNVPLSNRTKGGMFEDVLTYQGTSNGVTYLKFEYKYLDIVKRIKIYKINVLNY